MKTLALRFDDDLHAQLTVIAQLQEVTLTELIRTVVTTYVELASEAPDFADKAQALLDDIEREALNRRDALAALFAKPAAEPTTEPSKPSGRTRKAPNASIATGYA